MAETKEQVVGRLWGGWHDPKPVVVDYIEEAYEAGAAAQREKDARIAESFGMGFDAVDDIAAAIRRGEAEEEERRG